MLFPVTGLQQNIKSSKIQLLIQHSHTVNNKIETKLKTIHGACMVWYVCACVCTMWRLEEYTMCFLYHSPHYFGPEAFLSGHAGWQTSSQDLPDFVPNSSATPVLQARMVMPDFYVGIGMWIQVLLLSQPATLTHWATSPNSY